MTLGELIERLERESQDKILRNGFNNPHSYRGYYEYLAVEPCVNARVSDSLACLKVAVGRTYEVYKGG